MSYISTIGAFDNAAVSAPSVKGAAAPRVSQLSTGVADAAGQVLAVAVEGAVFLTIMAGLSLTFCVLAAGLV